jgi:hypothetical protein
VTAARVLREPLLHFLLLGAAIFAAYSLVQRHATDEPGRIVISQGRIEHLASGFARTWQRPPTREELAGLVRAHLREEVYCREALALGLDKDDTVIRRRLQQKMEFVSDDITAQAEPKDADLTAYLEAHPDSFRIPPRFTFRHVFLDPNKHGEHLAADAANLLATLSPTDVDAPAAGDSLLLEQQFASVPASEVAKQFGGKFAAALPDLTPGRWQGPVESDYGAHLVFIRERTEARTPALADVRDAVRREWENAKRLEANEQFYQELLKRYTVTIEEPGPASGQGKPADAKSK